MRERSTASDTGGMTDDQRRERDAINRDLDAIDAMIRRATGYHEEVALIEQAVGRVRLRVIALARSMGGADFARMMQPHDDAVGDNVVRLRRRVQ